ncbi:MAG: hypothetical protein H6841_07015 [Planctomycetes bacterium]|nr:hypothetical protein [Planctomycetota bacterium]MCB9935277.1 hypothetical protein [Planctomycetota bacterium]
MASWTAGSYVPPVEPTTQVYPMNRTTRTVILFLIGLAGGPLFASSLSVVSLADALKNPALEDIHSEGFLPAIQPVQAALLNQPADDEERLAFHARVSSLARHRDTRLGKLFFGALAATPDIENLPDDARLAGIEATWPLALGASARVRVEWRLADKTWRIADLQVTLDGLAAAPIAGMAPYFGSGELREGMLDMEVIDYLLGRDPADRELPASERPAFDYDAALARVFKSEAGAYESLIADLSAGINPQLEAEKRLDTLKPHLESQAEFDAIDKVAHNPERGRQFWDTVYLQIEQASGGPRPSAAPSAAGAQVRVRWSAAGAHESSCALLRLESGELSLRGLGEEE